MVIEVSKNKKIGLIVLVLWGAWALTYFLVGIDIKGSPVVEVKIGENYQDEGATGSFLGLPLKVTKKDNLNLQKAGKYQISYQARNFLGVKRTKIRYVTVVDGTKPVITLKGNIQEKIFLGESYQDPGYVAKDEVDVDITDKVQVKNYINFQKPGLYKVVYQVEDSSGNSTSIERIIQILERNLTYESKYDELDNSDNGWWSDNKKDKKRPAGAFPSLEYQNYGAYFMGPNERIIYLTFDEGSNDTYLKEIVEVLDKENVKGTLFLCGNYMKNNQELVKKWSDNGHSIGNHTYYHKNMTTLANSTNYKDFLDEIFSMEDLYQEITGKPMERIFRFPEGQWSMRALSMLNDLGYKTFFWSASYLDFLEDLSKEEALSKMLNLYHDGAIYLLHPKNKGNYEALSSFIQIMKQKGYSFGLVKDINSY